MQFLLTPPLMYAALVAQTALRFGGAGLWTPNLILLVGLTATRGRGGVLWAASAGLVCDAASGRPLGVTMLAATLAGAFVARLGGIRPAGRGIAAVLLAVGAVEVAARVLASTVVADPDLAAETLVALRVALTTACVAAVFELTARSVPRRFVHPPREGRSSGELAW